MPYNCWPSIIIESNRYATMDLEDGKTMDSKRLKHLTISGLKCFIVISLYMDMKKQPNLRIYLAKKESIFFCPINSSSIMQLQFGAIRHCLHIIDSTMYDYIKQGMLAFDKIC